MTKIYIDYKHFNKERLLMESIREMKFVLSPRLIEIISKINSEISDELIKSHNTIEFKTKQTFIDIAENMDDSISFILANKASQILDFTEEDNENTIFNRKMRDEIGLDNDVYTKFRGTMKLGRFINTVFPNKFPSSLRLEAGQKSKDVESFIAMYKTIINVNTKFDLFDVVKGDKISYWYNFRHYKNRNGSLGGSCMSDVRDSYFDIYCRNQNKVSLVILYSNNEKTEIRGRAILWELDIPQNRIFMDRIYTNNSNDEHLFIDFAKSNKWLFKEHQSYGPDSNIVDGITGISSHIKIKTKLDKNNLINNYEYDKYPYMDTMTYYNPITGIISNSEIGQMYILNSTGGSYDELDTDDIETVHSNYHNEDILQRNARWCEIGQDWVERDVALRVHNSNIGSHVYAVPGNPTIAHCFIPNITDRYFPMEKCIWSDYLNTWLFNSSSRKVYTDKDKSSFVLDHKKRENINFAKIGDDYFDINLVNKIGDNTFELK